MSRKAVSDMTSESRGSSPGSIFEKAALRKRPRVNDGFLQNKRRYASSFIFGRHFRNFQQSSSPNEKLMFENSADVQFPTSEYIEDLNNHLETSLQSALTSDEYSFDERTPVSKTKRFNHGLQVWLKKFQYYSRQSPFHKMKSERNYSFIDKKILSSPVEELPEDAYSCYNQFRTQDFGEFFDTLKIKKSKYASDEIYISDLPPLHHLSYESFQELRGQLFAFPSFSVGSAHENKEFKLQLKISEILDIVEDESEDESKEEKNMVKLDDLKRSAKSTGSKTSGIEGNQIQSCSTENQFIEKISKLRDNTSSTSEERTDSVNSNGNPEVVNSIIQDDSTSVSTPEIVRQLHNDSIESGEEFELNSAQFKLIDTLSINDHVLTPMERE